MEPDLFESHLVDRLLGEYEVVVLGDLSGGDMEFINRHVDKNNFIFIKGSMGSPEIAEKALWRLRSLSNS